jgi:hypothetical protein
LTEHHRCCSTTESDVLLLATLRHNSCYRCKRRTYEPHRRHSGTAASSAAALTAPAATLTSMQQCSMLQAGTPFLPPAAMLPIATAAVASAIACASVLQPSWCSCS